MGILGYVVKIATLGIIASSYTSNNNAPQMDNVITPPSPASTPAKINTAKLPAEKTIDCQFYAQAPKGNWNSPYGEYCEEASVILGANCLNNQQVKLDKFESQLKDIDGWFTSKFGASKDQSVQQMADAIKEKYNLNYKIIENPTFKDIQTAINSGNLIIAPLAGKMVKNPHYRNGGPNFHVLLVVGYKNDKIVTHDVGTRSGKNYEYKKNIFMDAIHDYTDKDIKKGAKRILVISK